MVYAQGYYPGRTDHRRSDAPYSVLPLGNGGVNGARGLAQPAGGGGLVELVESS